MTTANHAPATRPGDRVIRPTRRESAANAKRGVIMDAALDLFSRNGLHGTRIDQVAQRADVSKTNLLYYFPSKDALYVAVLERVLQEWLQPLENLQSDQDPEKALSAYIRHKMEMSRTSPAASRLFCMEMLQGAPRLMPVLQGSLKRLVNRKSSVLRNWAREGKIADVAPESLLYAIWGVTQHYADFAVQIIAVSKASLNDKRFEKRSTEAVLAILLRGILPR